MKKTIRILAFIMCLLFLVGALGPRSETQAALTNDTIKQKEKAIEDAEEEIKNLKSGKTQVESVISSLKDKKSDLAAYIEEIDGYIGDVQDKIDALDEAIETQQNLVDEIRIELANAVVAEQQQYINMMSRIRFMYENGEGTLAEILFSSESFSDFLTKAEYISRVTDYDHRLLDDYQDTVELVEMTKLELEAQEKLLEEAKAVQEEEMESLKTLQEAKNRELSETTSDIAEAQDSLEDYEAELQAMKDTIETLEAEITAEKKRLLEANASLLHYDGGKFLWPIAKYTRITSEYGYRVHPTLGYTLFHNGIDIASPYGTDIYAAYDGKVVAADYTSVMGNYIMIDHGDDVYTVYMHCSKLYVKKGDIVVTGETIAAVGSTGRSTGNHLHFSVRVNGSYVSPWNYVKEP